jgi:hypothetical protein
MHEVRPLLPPGDVARLREALASAGYTSAGIADRIGPAPVEAVRRNDFRGLLRATTDGDRLATLIRLFIAGSAEPPPAVAAALAPLPLAAALEAGLVRTDGPTVTAAVDLDLYGDGGSDWWVLSDVDTHGRGGAVRPDHVLGIGNAATTLAGATVRRPVGTALDVGTGCGVQSLLLSGHADSVTATDVSNRALRFAATTAALNGLRWELLAGDLVTPVAGRRFDLVVSNPPFVAGPPSTRYAYRDSGREGDEICAELAATAPAVLADGGTMQYLANWLHRTGEDWRDRVRAWVEGTGCDAWIIQRDVSEPVEYVDLWRRDAGEPPRATGTDTWLDWFDDRGIEGVGFGVVTLRRSGRADPVVRVEELRQQVETPLGVQVGAWFDRQDWLAPRRADGGAALLDECLMRAPDLRLTQEADHDGEDWAVGRQTLSLTGGLRWTDEVDPLALALVSGADGRTRVRDQVTVLAAAFDVPDAALTAAVPPMVAAMVERGLLLPAPPQR